MTTRPLPGESLLDARRRLELGLADSPFLTVSEAARFCRFDTVAHPETAFRQWARRNAIPARRRGRRVLLFDRRVLGVDPQSIREFHVRVQ